MASLFSIPTLMLCLLAGWAIIGLLTFVNWRREPERNELGLWSLGLGIGAFGVLLLGFRGILPNAWSLGVGNGLVFIGVGYIWQGFRAFDAKRVHHFHVFALAGTWFVAYFGFPPFAKDVNARIILSSLILSFELGMVALTVKKGNDTEPLPTRPVLYVLLAVYCLATLCRIPSSIVFPVEEINDVSVSLWYGPMTFMLNIISLLCGFGIFSLSRERLLLQYKHASETDMLTGILNRRAFVDRLKGTIAQGGLLILADIDYFKRVNDTFGHGGGDAVLVGFARVVEKPLARDMIFGRFGGEEFALFLPGNWSQSGFEFCENLRKTVEASAFQWHDKTIKTTVSIGAHCVPPQCSDLESALMAVDHALYAAKHSGRNCVILYDDLGARFAAKNLEAEGRADAGFRFTGMFSPQA
ncbi:GGDEF domain-containing protein [Allorhizobium terrae]|uniref:diguanylate cyclase n=1 Tax=Allorhizobium terrae TaxID=1848972 RepID=A0A4S4A1L7_9HYPH|nr:GGDEF domain-containing protein [Allorhizobium terrae]THF52198.1 GGDEF domain-containing protein [Allorhizobium terrae]